MKTYQAPDPEALFREAEQYEERRDFRKAFKCLLSAARLGNGGSQLNLGNFYAWGRGVRQNLEKAAFWYKKAYRNGYSDGALNLAIDARNAGNIRSAVTWFRKAIAMNNGEAYVALAKTYRGRKGGQETAAILLRRALQLNRDCISDDAKEEAKSLLKEMKKMQ